MLKVRPFRPLLVLIEPVGGKPHLGNSMHPISANLNFDHLTVPEDGRVEGLVHVGLCVCVCVCVCV